MTDGSEQLAGLAYAAANHGASFLAPNVTSLTPGSVDWYQPQLRELYPHITPQYLRFYKGRYQGSAYTKEVLAEVEALRQAYRLPERRVLPPRTSNRRTAGAGVVGEGYQAWASHSSGKTVYSPSGL